MAAATWIRDELTSRGLKFEELHHLDAYTAQEVAQKEHVSGHRIAKVVGVIADNQPIELILPASRRVDLKRVAALVGAERARLATEEELGRLFPDCEVGAIPALRHWQGVELIMDESLAGGGDLFILGGTHSDAIRIRFDDWFELVKPRVEDFSEPA
jgi:Ala-tRNA(Pro) deacylase